MHAPLDHNSFLDALKRSPAGEEIANAAAREAIAGRKKLAEQLAALEANAAKEWPRLVAASDAAAEAVKAAERALLEARQAYSRTMGERSQMSVGTDARRSEIERELRAGAHPAIAAFREEMDRARDAARMALDAVSERKVNKVTGAVETRSANNLESIRRRVAATLAAQDAADLLALEPDQGAVPAKLDELRKALPQIEKAVLS